MSGITITGAGYALPGRKVENSELCRNLDTDDEWIVSRTGIRRRYIAQDEETPATLAVSAAEKALAAAAGRDPDFAKDRICAVLAATMTSDYVFPSVACIMQKTLSLPKEIAAFDISAACTGFVYAMQTARAILQTEYVKKQKPDGGQQEARYVLVVGCECMSKVLDFTDRSSCILFGDGAGALVLKEDRSRKSMFLNYAGTVGNTEDLFCRKPPFGNGFLHMNGQAVYRFATTALRGAMQRLLEEAGITLDAVDYVVCHQANARIIESVRRKYPGHEEKFFMDLGDYANTSAASVAIALADLFGQGRLKPGMIVLAVAFGAGLSVNGILMTL